MKLNVDLLRDAADAIESSPELYCQNSFGDTTLNVKHKCGTPCCVAGFIVAVGRPYLSSSRPSFASVETLAAKLLNIDVEDVLALFEAVWPIAWFEKAGLKTGTHKGWYGSPNPKEAATILRAMADDGYIWSEY